MKSRKELEEWLIEHLKSMPDATTAEQNMIASLGVIAYTLLDIRDLLTKKK